jgi:biopolymer transport protein ExbD
MNRRARFNKKNNTTFALNINSMTDMFTIMLVFLLQTYSTNSYDVVPKMGLSMPLSVSEKQPEEAPMISLSRESLYLNDKNLAPLNNFSISADLLDQGEIIKPLLSELQAIKLAKKDKEEIILQIDKDCPYPKMKQVLSTASMAGFIKVRLATIASN